MSSLWLSRQVVLSRWRSLNAGEVSGLCRETPPLNSLRVVGGLRYTAIQSAPFFTALRTLGEQGMAHVDHVLIVDDDREIRELVGNYLQKNGLRTTVVADGRQMRAFLDANQVDLIVLDIMLPGDDGLQLCRELRVGKHKATPVLMLTARSDETDRIIGLEMGADDYLAKPFAARELLARINAVLRRTRMLPPNLVITESSRL